ncbi:MAG: universal stress protein [Nitrospira sp. CG24C]|jgi:nucleotide-binding universal stress UspA family protein|nr:MAG: universal stress protein [Nitrospira sp. CG24C]TKB55706.1 MAG: universal stress protein [Nitrospira sp.]
MKTLLAVDGSDNSYEAVHIMNYLARAEQLTLLHALDVPRPAYPEMMPEAAEELYKTLEQSMKEDGERLLNRVQSLLPLHAGPTTKHLKVGSPAGVIVSMAEEQKADLIVMGARGLGPIKERLLGSVSHQILTLASCATLIVNGPVKAMKQILLPLEGPSDAEAAIRFLRLKPFHEAVELTLMTVLPWTEPPWPSGAAAEAAATEILEKQTDYIEGVAERLRAIGYKAHGVAVIGTPATMILQQAATLRSDLIMMGTRGRQGITRFVLGSVSHAVLHKTPCPVLAFHS